MAMPTRLSRHICCYCQPSVATNRSKGFPSLLEFLHTACSTATDHVGVHIASCGARYHRISVLLLLHMICCCSVEHAPSWSIRPAVLRWSMTFRRWKVGSNCNLNLMPLKDLQSCDWFWCVGFRQLCKTRQALTKPVSQNAGED